MTFYNFFTGENPKKHTTFTKKSIVTIRRHNMGSPSGTLLFELLLTLSITSVAKKKVLFLDLREIVDYFSVALGNEIMLFILR